MTDPAGSCLSCDDTKKSEPVGRHACKCEVVIKYSKLPIMSDANDGNDVTEVTVYK